MKRRLFHFLMGMLMLCTFSANAQSSINPGIWQAFTSPLSVKQYPEIKGRLCNFYWGDMEKSPGVWDWTAFDADLTSRAKDGLPIIFMVYIRGPKSDAPAWLFTNGVPKVTIKDTKGNVIGSSPCYTDPIYKSYLKKMIAAVHQHVETLPTSVRSKIIGVQPCFGSTGDFISYQGGVVAPEYALTQKQFSDLFREFTLYYYDEYKNTSPKITILHNPKNAGKSDALWIAQTCPGGWIKCGTIGKGFQLNDELDKNAWLYDLVNKPQGDDFMRMRCETAGGKTGAGWWEKCRYKNMFALMCYGIYWGLDWPNQDNTGITDPLFDSSFNFFNKYAGQKDPAKSTNAMCALKDVLDASDGVRFPAATYGTVSRTNKTRYQNIANAYSAYGAKLEDLVSITGDEMACIRSTATNDVGWRLLPGNYERYLHQIKPNETSVGYWNVQSADANSMYGRFARGFDVATNKNAMYFDVDNAFLSNAPLNGSYPVTIEITYLDNGGGWQLYYDSKTGTDVPSIQVSCGTTNMWKKATVTLTDAYFGNRGLNASDFSIRCTNGKNAIFSVVELSRPSNFAGVSSRVSSVESELQITSKLPVSQDKGVSISPNPVTSQFYVELKDHNAITDIAIYSQSGQLVLRKKVSGTKVYIQKSEIGGASGVYEIKVLSGKTSYAGKLLVL